MPDDKWSRWLNDERCGDHRRLLEFALNAVRDRILGIADLRSGERLIDLGSGTGLLGLGAAEILGPSGAVAFVDISDDSLRTAAAQASDASASSPATFSTAQCVTGGPTPQLCALSSSISRIGLPPLTR